MLEAASLYGSLGPFSLDERATGERGWVEERFFETEARERERERASAGKTFTGRAEVDFFSLFSAWLFSL